MATSILRWGHSALELVLRLNDQADDGAVALVGLSDRPPSRSERSEPGSDNQPTSPGDGSVPLVEVIVAGHGRNVSHSGYADSAVGARLRYERHAESVEHGWQRLVVHLRDPVTDIEVQAVFLTVDGVSVVRSWAEVTNQGTAPVTLYAITSFAAGGFPAAAEDVSLLSARSEWLAESRWSLQPLRPAATPYVNPDLHGYQPRGRISGTSHGTWSTGECLPTAGLVDTAAGQAWLWQIEHNGAWHWEVGVRRDGAYVLLLGPTDADSQWQQTIRPGETFASVPVAVAVTSSGGAEAAFGTLTRYRRALRRPHPDHESCPVVFNDYMNTLMGDPTTQKLLPLIAAAASVGVETFVIDAGWYDDGSDWWDSVGEWQPSTGRFPNGLVEVTTAIQDAGMAIGLWLEPEVVGVRSPIANKLPGNAYFERDGVRVVEARRHHLDLRHTESVRHLDATVDRLVAEQNVSYFKLDYNINPGAGTDVGGNGPGAGLLEHNRAHLAWLDSVLDRHPRLTIENCASGAMRMDYAMLSRLQLQSTSDQQDFRLYPPMAVAAPASITPEQAASWAYPQPEMSAEEMAFTLCTGMAGRLYLSGHLDGMNAEQLALVTEAVTTYKAIRREIATSIPFWPLGLPQWDDGWLALGFDADGLDAGGVSYLVIWCRSPTTTTLELPVQPYAGRQLRVDLVFPTRLTEWEFTWRADEAILSVRSTVSVASARLLRLTSLPNSAIEREEHSGF
jgi:alpha-galactosidase